MRGGVGGVGGRVAGLGWVVLMLGTLPPPSPSSGWSLCLDNLLFSLSPTPPLGFEVSLRCHFL